MASTLVSSLASPSICSVRWAVMKPPDAACSSPPKSICAPKTKISDATFVVQGFGNVGSHSARSFHERGGKVVAIGDHTAAYYDPEGIHIPAALAYVKEKKVLAGWTGAPSIPATKFSSTNADVMS